MTKYTDLKPPFDPRLDVDSQRYVVYNVEEKRVMRSTQDISQAVRICMRLNGDREIAEYAIADKDANTYLSGWRKLREVKNDHSQ